MKLKKHYFLTIALLGIAGLALFLYSCMHKPIDPGVTKDKEISSYSLPAKTTSGTIKFRAQMYKTDGPQEIKEYNTTGYNGVELTYNVVGAEMQFYQVKKPNGSFTYRPRWVISGGSTQNDVNNKKNIIIITLLPDYDDEADNKLECTKAQNKDAVDFCENLLDSGLFKTFNNEGSPLEFHSFEADQYPQCSESDAIKPFDVNGIGIDPDDETPGDCNKEYYYKADGGLEKKFNVVVEFIDINGNVYTTKFPYNKEVDNLGNHTPALITVANIPNPYLNPLAFTGATDAIDRFIFSTAGNSNAFSDKNCVGIQKIESSYDCSVLITKITQTINNNNGTINNRMDDDIIHKLQQAGKEFRAKGTDQDPRFEMMITDIHFRVERGANNFITKD